MINSKVLKRFLTFILFAFISSSIYGQLIINQTGTVAQWVQNNLVGTGVTVSNVTFSGSAQSIGTFSSGTTTGNLGFNSGLVISTGNVSQLPGPGSAFCSANVGGGSDPLLAALITQSIKDATILEFDFIPVSDTLKFRYVFGSEEYPEFVNSINDVFGFFVSGLNPYGGSYSNVNVALIPGTSTPITINNVNPNVNSAYYVNNAYGTFVKLDGFTTVLTAWIRVIPCVTYHIKIAIGDAQDHIYDSGVFFEANSFMSNAILIDQTTSSLIDTTAVEGCNDAIITFKLPHIRATPTYINYYATGTAINGTDYTQIPSFVIIPAGQDSINLTIHPILDNIVEPTEYVDLIVNTSACTYDTVRVSIKDNSSPVATIPNDTVICGSGTVNLTSTVSGGYSPYTYLWSNGDTNANTVVNPTTTTTYSLVVSDLCQNDSTSEMTIKVSEPIFQVFGDTVCIGDSALLYVVDSAANTYLWNDGSITSQLLVSPNLSTQYHVTVTDSLGCTNQDIAMVIINPLPIINTSPDTIICNGSSAKLRAYGNYNFLWGTGSNSSSIVVSPNILTTYDLTITDINQCQNTTQIEIDVLPIPTAEIISDYDTICIGQTTTLSANGGDEYQWNNGSFLQNISVHPETNTEYTLTVTSISNYTYCSHDTSFILGVKRCNYFYFPNAFTPDGNGLNEGFGVVGVFEAIVSFQFYIYDRWGNQVFYSDNPTEKWNGRINGIDATSDVYTYIVFIKEGYSEAYTLKGTVHLVR